MDIFVVRLNPDPRNGKPYSRYPTVDEYNKIYENSVMDGFHEAVNFLYESGSVKGYLPPRFLSKIKTSEEFILITITAKGAKDGGDKIIGIQAGCRYIGDRKRAGGKAVIKKFGLTYHYSCPASLSLLFDSPLSGARERVIEKNRYWWRGPTYEVRKKATIKKIIQNAINEECIQEDNAALQRIISVLDLNRPAVNRELESDSTFDDEVEKILKAKKAKKVKGNKRPSQKEVRSYQFERDPQVAAYALQTANGTCHDCKKKGPFISKRTNMPFLEVHHITQLKDGGEDTIDNVVALCPNCHRKRHYG